MDAACNFGRDMRSLKKIILIIVAVLGFVDVSHADVERTYTKTIIVQGEEIELTNGVDLSKRDLRGIHICRSNQTLKNINFDGANLEHADFWEVVFENCSFRNVRLASASTYACHFINCDFQGTEISNSGVYGLDFNSLRTTDDYKRRFFVNCEFRNFDLSELDFKGFTFRDVKFVDVRGNATIDFTDVYFQNVIFLRSFRLTKEQILSTKNFKRGFFQGVVFEKFRDVSSEPISLSGVDCSRMIFINCKMNFDFQNTSLSNSVISGDFAGSGSFSDFSDAKNLTWEQIQSTWNYKHGRMEGIRLPEHIQEALDADTGG